MLQARFITNIESLASKKIGNRHLGRCREIGNFQAELFEAVKGAAGYDFLKNIGVEFLRKSYQPDEFVKLNAIRHYDERPGIVGCFASHYQLWQKCIKDDATLLICEYDAWQKIPMPNLDYGELLYLSAWRNFNNDQNDYGLKRSSPGIHPYVGYDRWGFKNCMSGTHAYLLKPSGAAKLIEATHTKGWFPVDRFMSTDLVDIQKQTINPPVFVVQDSLNLSNEYEKNK